jgi:MobA/MobL family protein
VALYHVHAGVIRKGQSAGGATGFAQYIAREHPEHATQFARYVHREGWAKEDLVATGAGGLPAWAHSSTHFWLMADRYERGGAHRPRTVARTYEIALPRELSPEARLELAADIRETFFERYPHSWALHNPIDAQGLEHPHMHLMLSERGPDDGIDRGPKLYLSQAAGPHHDPATYGVRKDRSWQGPARLHELRAGIATLTNAALERAGVQAAVSHASLKARLLSREAAVYTRAEDKAQVEARREELHRYHHPFEATENWVMWREQKAREGIRDVGREAMIDHVRDKFWRRDTSPAREQERAQSLARSIAREHQRTGRPLQGPRVEAPRPSLADLTTRLTQLQAMLARMSQEEPQAGAALNVRLISGRSGSRAWASSARRAGQRARPGGALGPSRAL